MKDPKQKRLAIIAAVFLVAAAVLYWRLFFSNTRPPAPAPLQSSPPRAVVPKPGAVSEEALKRARLDTDVVKTELFQELRFYGDYPIVIPEKGNPKPFERPK